MALWKRAGTYQLDIAAPDGTRIRRSTGTTDREKAKEYHDRLKAELWDLKRLKRKPLRTWDEAALRWLKEKTHKKSYRDDVQRIQWFTGHLRGKTLDQRPRAGRWDRDEAPRCVGSHEGSLCGAHPRHIPTGDAGVGVDRDDALVQDLRPRR